MWRAVLPGELCLFFFAGNPWAYHSSSAGTTSLNEACGMQLPYLGAILFLTETSEAENYRLVIFYFAACFPMVTS